MVYQNSSTDRRDPSRHFGGRSALVTGGAGFIGSHLVDALLAAGARVRVLDDLSTGREENLDHVATSIEWIRGDIRDLVTCRDACAEVDFVFHQAALGSVPRSLTDPATTIAVNVAGTANVCAAARDAGVQRIVYASSSSVYGDSQELPKREGQEGAPLSPYALSKVMCEKLAAQFGSSFGLELLGLRYFNVFGPRQSPDGPYAAVIPRFFAAALRGEPLKVFGDGEQSRDFTAVADAVAANLLAATAEASAVGGIYNVAAGRRTSVNRLARTIAALVGSSGGFEHVEARPGDVRHSLADLRRSEQHLGYRPRIDLERGLEACLDFYRTLFSRA